MVQLFGILSVVLMLFSGILLVRQIKRGVSIPNLTTWLIILLVSLINSLTFYEIVDHNIWKGLAMFASLLVLIVIVLYSFSRSKFAKLKIFDAVILIVAVFVGVIWKLSHDDRMANFLVQIIMFIASIPTIWGLWKGYLREYYLSWLLGISAYLCLVASILVDFHGDWLQLFGPLFNGVVGNGIIMFLSFKKNKEKKS